MSPPSPFIEEAIDPLASPSREGHENQPPLRPDRPWYATGVLLDAEDFQAEQLYHRAQLAEAMSCLGGCGTLAGLKVTWQREIAASGSTPAREEEITVQPGLAVDRFGRLIEVPRPACLRLRRWLRDLKDPTSHLQDLTVNGATIQGIVADVFLRFLALPRGYTPAVAAGPYDATDAVQPSRIRDSYKLDLVPRPGTMSTQDRLPADPWAPLRTVAADQRWQTLQSLILAGGPGGIDRWGSTDLQQRPEHEGGVAPTALFLARLLIPVDPSANPLTRRTNQEVTVRNDLRELVLSTTALAAWAGIPARSTF